MYRARRGTTKKTGSTSMRVHGRRILDSVRQLLALVLPCVMRESCPTAAHTPQPQAAQSKHWCRRCLRMRALAASVRPRCPRRLRLLKICAATPSTDRCQRRAPRHRPPARIRRLRCRAHPSLHGPQLGPEPSPSRPDVVVTPNFRRSRAVTLTLSVCTYVKISNYPSGRDVPNTLDYTEDCFVHISFSRMRSARQAMQCSDCNY